MDETNYAEVIVPRKTESWVIPAMIGTGILLFLSFLLAVSIQWGWVAIIAVITAIAVGWRYVKVEYEYIFVIDELTVTKIYSGVKRKKGPKIDMHSMESMEPFREGMEEQIKQNPSAVLEDFSSHQTGDPVYVIRYATEGKTHFLLLEPTERLLNVMWRAAPSKVKKR
ncbi:MAG: hypothetical protein IJM50_01825 [Lachnospiraceae bacterium]|nr:hypothetical protein [Lachnospiraceae bacterium]